MLTNAQAETIRALRDRCLSPGAELEPRQLFPNRDNQDNGHRRTLSKLADLGILERSSISGNYRMTQRALDAYQEWYTKRGWRYE